MPPRKVLQSSKKSHTPSEIKEQTISNSQTSEVSDGGDLATLLSQLQGAVAKKQKASKKALMIQSTDEAALWISRLEETYAERKKAHQVLCDESFALLEKDQEEVIDSIEKLMQLENQFKEFCDHLKIEQVDSARFRESAVHGYMVDLEETLLGTNTT
ncbi:hypothetical protein [Phaffia rhodozyma]|uniref:Uncharacterized protein n=1 Tax=Phaffia rhodozyma TaxID=264483 RepID=A0A0F7STF9_PHARH|nr:hypothetical protein [Phaffia rhodozyma]